MKSNRTCFTFRPFQHTKSYTKNIKMKVIQSNSHILHSSILDCSKSLSWFLHLQTSNGTSQWPRTKYEAEG